MISSSVRCSFFRGLQKRSITVGDRIPNVAGLKLIKDGATTAVDSESLFKGKKVAIFGLPAAFSPGETEQNTLYRRNS